MRPAGASFRRQRTAVPPAVVVTAVLLAGTVPAVLANRN